MVNKKSVIPLLLVLTIACGGNWKATAHTLGDRTYDALNTASKVADEMVLSQSMTKEQRQQFAKEIMLPSINALEGAIQSVIAWKEGEPIPENVSRLIGILTKATDDVAKTFGANSELHNALLVAKNRASGLLAQVQ